MPKRIITHGARNPFRSTRGSALLAYAAFFGIFAYALLNPSPTSVAQGERVTYAYALADPDQWGWVWAVAAVVVFVGAVAHFDKWAFTASAGLMAGWGSFYVVAWAHGDALGRPWLATAFFVVFAWLALVVAGVHDEPTPTPRRP